MTYNQDLVENVVSNYKARFNNEATVIIRSPGRVNLIGEHTDYNNGFVLPATLEQCFILALGPNEEEKCHLTALDIDESFCFSIHDLSKTNKTWVNFLKGILSQCAQKGLVFSGFNCMFSSSIPMGSGLSSSTALDCGFLKGIDTLFNYNLSKWDIVHMSNKSNNEFIGVQGGILDQFAIVFGKKNYGMLLDCLTMEFKYLEIQIENYQWILLDSKVRHDNTQSGYNDRPEECKVLLKLLQKKGFELRTFRDIKMEHLLKNKDWLTPKLIKRAIFIIQENLRVVEFKKAIQRKDVNRLGELLYASHQGLRDQYEVSCKELDLLVALAMKCRGVVGSRMVGGGFGGCTLSLVQKKNVSEFIAHIKEQYLIKTKKEVGVIRVAIDQGLEVINIT